MNKIALINLVRRGGMVHYHSQLANALADQFSLEAVIAEEVNKDQYSDSVRFRLVDTGANSRSTLIKLCNPLTWVKMWKIIHSLDVQALHITSSYIWNIFFIFEFKRPIIYTVHDPEPHEGERVWLKWIESWMRKKARLLIVHGEIAKKQLIEQGYKSENIRVMSIGDFSLFKRWESDESKEEEALLFFGRIEPYKGLNILLDSMRSIWKEFPSWRLIIAGHGDMGKHEVLQDKRVEVHNRFIEDEEVASFFQRSSVVVLPYISATQSGVIPIASSFAKPVVATKVGSLNEAVEDGVTGILVEPNSIDKISEAVRLLLRDRSLRNKMGNAANIKIKASSSAVSISENYFDMYNKLVEYK